MARRRREKPKESFPTAKEDSPAVQMNHFVESMETYTKHKIECFVCQKRESDRDVTDVQFARWLFNAGWRHATSEKYMTTGAMCPRCAKAPDNERL